MLKITNGDLTQSDTGCFIDVLIWQQWASKGVKLIVFTDVFGKVSV